MQHFIRVIRKIVFGLILILLAVVATLWGVMRLTLPARGKQISVPGLSTKVTIEEDRHDVPTIRAEKLSDLLRAQGWVTARDRFFQMDLIRRRSAGRLAEIFGKVALDSDRRHRLWGMDHEATVVVEKMPVGLRRRLEAYAEGVNAYLSQGPLPFEVKLLAYRPEPWQPKDTVLAAFGMFESLSEPDDSAEKVREALSLAFPQPVVDYLTADYGFLDAPMQGDPANLSYPPVPPPELFDAGKQASFRLSRPPREQTVWGSNAWAVSGKLTASGKPMLAGDPHLTLSVPNVWYRVKLMGAGLQVLGASLPGVPGVVIGSSGSLAWSFTNTRADTVDLVELAIKDGGFVSDGAVRPFTVRHERIEVRGGAAVGMDVKETPWGPVIEETGATARALEWTALDPDALEGIDLIDLDRARSVQQGLEALSAWAGPVQNVLLASSDGHIAWTMAGKIPNRVGFDGRVPAPRDSTHFWRGYLPYNRLPKIIDPPAGFLVNANQRSVAITPGPPPFGYDYPSPARAYRIQQLLQNRTRLAPSDMLRIQADVHSLTHLWYRDRLLEALSRRGPGSPDERWFQAMEDLCRNWDGELSIQSQAYPFLKKFRLQVLSDVLEPFLGRLPEAIRDDAEDSLSHDALVADLLKNHPRNLLTARYADYDDLLRDAALVAAKATAAAPEYLGSRHWGEDNRGRIDHPFSLFLPRFLGSFLDMPHVAFPGDSLVPCALHPKHGPSMRMVVDLSDSAKSIFNQPGGQSGHPLSGFYSDQFASWLAAKPASFEPGPPVASEVLSP